jgi:hypothetical protein
MECTTSAWGTPPRSKRPYCSHRPGHILNPLRSGDRQMRTWIPFKSPIEGGRETVRPLCSGLNGLALTGRGRLPIKNGTVGSVMAKVGSRNCR